MRRRKTAAKTADSAKNPSRLDRLKSNLPKIQPGTPAPLIWAASGALIGLGISVGSAAMSNMVERNLQFVGLLLSALLRSFPVAMAGALLGAFVALGWFGCRR
jgi:hypothetical protein